MTTRPDGPVDLLAAGGGRARLGASILRMMRAMPPVTRLLSANVVIAAATFLTGVILARGLGPAGRGELANIILWPAFLSHLALCGVHVYLSRSAAQKPDAVRHHYRLGYRIVLLGSVAASLFYLAVLMVAGRHIVSQAGWPLVLAAGLIIPFSTWNSLQVQMELGRGTLGCYALARASFALIHFLFVALLWTSQSQDVAAYLWAFIGAALMAAGGTHFAINRSLPAAPASPEVCEPEQSLTHAIRSAWPFAVSIAVISMASSADRIAVSAAFDASTMGLYVIALALSQVQSVVNDAISPLFFTRVANAANLGSMDHAWLAMRLRQSVLINAAISAMLLIAAPLLIPIIYGSAYGDSLHIVQLLVPAMCARSMMQPFQEALKGGNRPLRQSFAILTTTAVFVIGAALAVWFHTIQGVAIALIVSGVVGLAIVARTVAIECHLSMRQLLLPTMADIMQLVAEMKRMARL